ncbi:MAG: cytochrome c3 family protein [Oryzomonas sp.]
MNTRRSWLAAIIVPLLLAALPRPGLGITVPDMITLNNPGKLYASITFNHAKHITLTKECSDCHHHTTGTLVQDPNCIRCHRNSGETKTVACRGCHMQDPFTAVAMREKDPKNYHLDKPGLKGAMHQACIGCHSKMNGPTGCQGCHQLTKEGQAFYNAGQFAPKGKTVKYEHE